MLKKILKYNKASIVIFTICSIILIFSIITTIIYKNKKTEGLLEKAEDYSTVIANNEEQEGKFVYIKIVDEPYLVAILELCCIVAGIIGVIYLIVIVKGCININKSLKNTDREELKNELLQPGVTEYPKAKILFLDKYFVSMDVGMIANEYSDIAWVYISHNARTKLGTYYHSVSNKSNLQVYLKNGKKYTTATVRINNNDVYSEIMEELAKKNSNIMMGYTFENLNNYNKIKNDNLGGKKHG